MTLPYSTYNTGEMTLYVRDNADTETAKEVQSRDIYRVRQLSAEGFNPKIIVDIGGHIGTFSTLAAKYWPESRIFVFEPSLTSFAVLSANVPENVTAMRAAVIGYYGKDKGLTISPSHGDEPGWRATVGKCISWETLAAIVGHPIDFLKIDCEQSEINIFREMDELNAIKDITYIHGEWHLPVARDLVKQLLTVHHTLEIVDPGHDQWDMFWAKKK